MKKIYIFLSLSLALILLPYFTSQMMEKKLEENIKILKSHGIKLKTIDKKSSYLSTTNKYEILIEDKNKLIKFINSKSRRDIPEYFEDILEGATLGLDLKYCHIPIGKSTSIDLYPVNLSKKFMQNIQDIDSKFYNHFLGRLKKKVFLYHIDYDILRDKFASYIKDIDEKHNFTSGTKAHLYLKSLTYNGDGLILFPTAFKMVGDKFGFNIENDKETYILRVDKFSNRYTSNQNKTFTDDLKLEKFYMKSTLEDKQDIHLELSKLYSNTNLIEENNQTSLALESSMEYINLKFNNTDFNAKDIDFSMLIDNTNTDLIKDFVKSSVKKEISWSDSALALISHGIACKIDNFSIKNISINKEDLEDFTGSLDAKLKTNPSYTTGFVVSPLYVYRNADIHLELKLSKKLKDYLQANITQSTLLDGYEKEENGKFVYTFTFLDAEFRVNSKAVY